MALTLAQIEARVDTAGRHPWWAFVRRHPLLVIGGVLLAMMALIALLAPWIAPYSPIVVTIGTAAFFSACRSSRRVLPTPRARAVRM